MEKKLQKLYLTDYNLLTAQDLWKAYYKILLIILLKEFIKLNVQTVIHVVLNTKTLKIIQQNTNVYVGIKIAKKSLMKT